MSDLHYTDMKIPGIISLMRESQMRLLCGDAHGTQFARMRLLTRPDEQMPPADLVRISPRELNFRCGNAARAQALGQAREFAE